MSQVDHELEVDVLVIGGGLAGTCAAIKAREYGAERVALVEKGKVSRTGMSTFGAGVMLVRLPENDPEEWMVQVLEHGEYVNDQDWVQLMAARGYESVVEIAEWGVTFAKEDGEFVRVLGRGQAEGKSHRNIIFRGPQMMEAMRRKCIKSGVKLVERVMVTDLQVRDGRVLGAYGFHGRSGETYQFRAGSVIMAAGSNAFKGTFLGQRNVTGDSYAMMYRAGVTMISLEFSTANSTSRDYDLAGMNLLVGLGGKFTNRLGERFLDRYDPVYRDRAQNPRLTAAMAMEVKEGRGPIYLDLTSLSPQDIRMIRDHAPTTMKILDKTGIGLQTTKIEWMPAMIGFGSGRAGGAWINTKCETNLAGLYAVGDAAWSSYQGAGAFGGPNFPFCAVSGDIGAKEAVSYAQSHRNGAREGRSTSDEAVGRILKPLRSKGSLLPDEVLLQLQSALFRYDTLLLRHGERLQQRLAEIRDLARLADSQLRAPDPHELRMAHEVVNMIRVGEMILASALAREESRGGAIREDFPETDNVKWLKWVTARSEQGQMEIATTDIPVERYPYRPKEERFVHPIFVGTRSSLRKQG